MGIRTLAVEHYRSFRDRQEIELAPVTVVLGKNNSGKSALVRLPLVLSTGFGSASMEPLDLDRLGPDAVDDFRELFFDQQTHKRLKLWVETDGPRPFRVEAELDYLDDDRTAAVSRLTAVVDGVGRELVAAHHKSDQRAPDIDAIGTAPVRTSDNLLNARDFVITQDAEDGIGIASRRESVEFRGLLPAWPEYAGLDLGPIRYLGAYRGPVARQHRRAHTRPAAIGSQGEHLPAIFAFDRERTGGVLLARVNEMLAGIIPGWRIDEMPAGPMRSTVLTRPGSEVRVNLADAGSGLAQVLPIIAQCAQDELDGADRRALQIIEEPELHLHPAAHAELADLYLRAARVTGTQFLIETHSETLLLRLRRRIAEPDNDLAPETVAIYVVEQDDGVSTVRRVGLDDLGNLDAGWPPGYFSQDYNEVRALAAAQAEQARRAS